MSLISEAIAIFPALLSGDAWTIRNAVGTGGAWLTGAVVLLAAAFLISTLYRKVPFIERHFERTVMVGSYLAIAGIIFWGVIDRFVFANQQPWSTTVPPLLFMIMAWFGAAYNVKLRTHLAFAEFRTAMPRTGQFLCLTLDFVLWFGFALILLVTTVRSTVLSASNFQIVLGTDNTMQWWFIATAPLAATLIGVRAFMNYRDDIDNLKSGEPLLKQAVIGAD
ncbi:MAG: TRAP transporter small permease subunit [Pseudomonadota bacterium]